MNEKRPDNPPESPAPRAVDHVFESGNVARAVLGEAIVEFLPSLEKADLRVLLIHLLRFNGAPGSSYPQTNSVARMTGLSERSVRRARERLVDFGLMRVEAPAHGQLSGKYSVDQCVRFSDSYRKKRVDSTPADVVQESLFTRPPAPGSDSSPGHGRPTTRPRASDYPATGVRHKEQHKEQQETTPKPRGLFEELPVGSDSPPANATETPPESFAESLGRWLSREVHEFASENQLDKIRAFVKQYGESHSEALRDPAFCREVITSAKEFQGKADRKIGFLHAWAIRATAILEQSQKEEAKRADKTAAIVAKKRAELRSLAHFHETELVHARQQLALTTDAEGRSVWESTIATAEAGIREVEELLNPPVAG